jgi:hypothetical protein
MGFVVEPDGIITNKMVFVDAVNCEYGLLYDGEEINAMERKINRILNDIPKLNPAKVKGKNVAFKFAIRVHVDCFMR